MTQTPLLFANRTAEPSPIGWFRRVFARAVNTAGARAAVHNLCVEHGEPRLDQLSVALKRHGVVRPDAQRSVLIQVCSDALSRVLQWEPAMISEGRAQVQRLASSLGLSSSDAGQVERQAATAHIRRVIRSALDDRIFTSEERAQVWASGAALGIPEPEIEAMVRSEVEPILTGALAEALDDRRYSPSEETALRKLAADLGVGLQLDSQTTEKVDRFRLLWQIENGQLPVVAAPITLQRKEVCHYICDCSWRELRTRTVRVNYSGPTARVRIMKGVYWRVGSIAPQRVTETNLVETASGTLYVTSKRVILDGAAGNKSVTWRTVFGQEVFADAIKLEKSAGKDPYLFIPSSEIEVVSAVISSAMAAAG